MVNNIRYASIRNLDISNGEGVGVALFVQGCHFHCYNCFNPNTWDFNGGKEWTKQKEKEFLELVNRPYIKRISLLGGEPLADENLDSMLKLVNKINVLFPKKTIWIYTGYAFEQIMNPIVTDDFNPERDNLINKRKEIVKQCDVLVDSRYIDELRDITLKWRGSRNQRVIDIQKSLETNSMVLYCE